MGFPLLSLPEELIIQVLASINDYDTWLAVHLIPELFDRLRTVKTMVTNMIQESSGSTGGIFYKQLVHVKNIADLRPSEVCELELACPIDRGVLEAVCRSIHGRCFANLAFRGMDGDITIPLLGLAHLDDALACITMEMSDTVTIELIDLTDMFGHALVNLKSPIFIRGVVNNLSISGMDVVGEIHAAASISTVEITDCSSRTLTTIESIIKRSKLLEITTTDSQVLLGIFGSIFRHTPSWVTTRIEFRNEPYTLEGLTVDQPVLLTFDSVKTLTDFAILDAGELEETGFVLTTIPGSSSLDDLPSELQSPVIQSVNSSNLTTWTVISYAKLPKFREINLPKLKVLNLVLHLFNDVSLLDGIEPETDLDVFKTVTDLSLENGLDLLILNPSKLFNLRSITMVVASEMEELSKLDSISLPLLELFELNATNRYVQWDFPPKWDMPRLKALKVSVESSPRSWNLQQTSFLHPELQSLCLIMPPGFGMDDSTPDGETVRFPKLLRMTLCGVNYNSAVKYTLPQLEWTLLSLDSPARFSGYDMHIPRIKDMALELVRQTMQRDDRRDTVRVGGFSTLLSLYLSGFKNISLHGMPKLTSLGITVQKVESLKSDQPLLSLAELDIKGKWDVLDLPVKPDAEAVFDDFAQ